MISKWAHDQIVANLKDQIERLRDDLDLERARSKESQEKLLEVLKSSRPQAVVRVPQAPEPDPFGSEFDTPIPASPATIASRNRTLPFNLEVRPPRMFSSEKADAEREAKAAALQGGVIISGSAEE